MPDTMIATPAAVSSITPAIPVEITKAIVAVMAGIGKLAKVEKNLHDRYDFVSIDGFLAAVNPLCAENGLVIIQDEEAVEFVERQGRNGSSTWLRVTYSFTICHVSGAVMPRQPRRTVMTIANGAQAFGSAQSYSLKQFLRSLFQISTGDKDDPDFQQTQDIGQQAPQKPVQQPQAQGRHNPPSKAPQAIQRLPSGFSEPQHIPMAVDAGGFLIREWLDAAKAAIDGKPEAWRRKWLELHTAELADLRRVRSDWADRVEAAAISPDIQQAAE
jgi:hypothetical protein